MKSKGKSQREFVFTSSFALKDTASRLRNLAQKRHWKIEFDSIDNDTYSFRISAGRWIPTGVSGHIQRDENHTLVTGTGSINWLVLLAALVVGLTFAFYQVDNVLGGLTLLRDTPAIYLGLTQGDLMTLASVMFSMMLLVPQIGLGIGFCWILYKLYNGHKNVMSAVEKSLVDGIPDLPQTANSITTEDGELVSIDDLPFALEESAKQKR